MSRGDESLRSRGSDGDTLRDFGRGIVGFFEDAASRFRHRPALEVDGEVFSYGELRVLAHRFAAALAEEGSATPVGVLAARSAVAYGGILGTLYGGRTYVPLNPNFPTERGARMLMAAGCRAVIVDEPNLSLVADIAGSCAAPLTALVMPHAQVHSTLAKRLEEQSVRLIRVSDLPPPSFASEAPSAVDPDSPAYILFTSGTTGEPKGVAVSHDNVATYVRNIVALYDLGPRDRASQTFDLTFDLSVHDMFTTWTAGACLCVLPARALLAPGPFIRKAKLTSWFSVPTVGTFMDQFRQLRPGAFPTLRLSLFCGEPLLSKIAEKWQAAAPESRVENLYGPTEATIAITRYQWKTSSAAECVNGVVPIGWALEGQKTLVVDSQLTPVSVGQPGELLLGGSQVTKGYLNNAEKTKSQFVTIHGARWYRTGDRVRVRENDGCLVYLGRVDEQVQIRGYRVELQEVDAALREASGTQDAVAVPTSLKAGRADGIVGYIVAESVDVQAILTTCRKMLPDYMMPSRIVLCEMLPLNTNGKISRKTLIEKEMTGK